LYAKVPEQKRRESAGPKNKQISKVKNNKEIKQGKKIAF